MGALAVRARLAPTIIDKVGGERPRRALPQPLDLEADAWHAVVQAMRGVTGDPQGTARPSEETGLDLTGYDLATKTGTPQIGGRADSSWFAGFFPAHEPRYAFAVFLSETGAHGGEVCAPIFQDLLQSEAFAEIEAVARKLDR
jgi:cell division protein FtsI/penicillin-binding protein 2